AALAALVAQTADHGQVLAERLEGLQDKRKLEITAGLLGLPFVLKGPMRKVNEAQPRLRNRRGLSQCRGCPDHGLQQGQGDRGAGAFQHGASRQMFSRKKHFFWSPSSQKLSLFNVQLSFVIFGCAFGAASLRKTARSATFDD